MLRSSPSEHDLEVFERFLQELDEVETDKQEDWRHQMSWAWFYLEKFAKRLGPMFLEAVHSYRFPFEEHPEMDPDHPDYPFSETGIE